MYLKGYQTHWEIGEMRKKIMMRDYFPLIRLAKLKKDSDSITSGNDVGKMVLPELPVRDMSLSDFLESYMTT